MIHSFTGGGCLAVVALFVCALSKRANASVLLSDAQRHIKEEFEVGSIWRRLVVSIVKISSIRTKTKSSFKNLFPVKKTFTSIIYSNHKT